MRPLEVRWLGRVSYAEALDEQKRRTISRRREESPDTLLLLEHPPVITLGRGSRPEHVLLSPEELTRRGIELHECGRGGDVTYHGPGQLIGYPILALPPERRDAHRYLRDLEEVLIRTAADHGVVAGRVPGLTGVWVAREKLAAIGVRLSTGWITSHGFALNVAGDLAGFSTIVPCGIQDRGVTSLSTASGSEAAVRDVARQTALRFAEVFGLAPRAADAPDERLELAVPANPPVSYGPIATELHGGSS